MVLFKEGNSRKRSRGRPGFTLIVVILVVAFLLSVGIALLSVTGTAPKMADNIRYQEQALSAAEAGFDLSWEDLDSSVSTGQLSSFEEKYLKDPAGIDLPTAANYYRKLTDAELLSLLDPDGDGTCNYQNVLAFKETFQPSLLSGQVPLTYTVFLIDDEAGGGTPDNTDVIMVCIGTAGSGPSLTTSRLEIVLQAESAVGP
jgi:hypothetical protein